MEATMGYGGDVTEVLYGGDYNPEQWPEHIWEEDMRLFKNANINIVTLNVFSWASLQPSENEYDFSKLDRIMQLVKENGLKVCMATSTGAHPAWMAKRHPDILRTDANGIKRKFGGRHNSCPNSPAYRKYAPMLARELSKRYKNYDNIVGWHISNEFGGECYCENCERAFRKWLKEKYKNIETVNKCYNTAFWGIHFMILMKLCYLIILVNILEMNRQCFKVFLLIIGGLCQTVCLSVSNLNMIVLRWRYLMQELQQILCGSTKVWIIKNGQKIWTLFPGIVILRLKTKYLQLHFAMT